MHPRRRTIAILAALSAACLCAQDVEQVADDFRKSVRRPVTVRGSVGASSVGYQADGIAPRRDPFYWILNANLTISVFDKLTVPLTAVLTQQDKSFSNGLDRFSQPFNQFGISPRYRWLTVHAGYRSMEFSEYSLSGALWLGGGVEIRPERSVWSGSAFYGRFLKAVPKGGIDGIAVSVPAFERWGGGAQLQVGDEVTNAQFGFIRITDNLRSIPFDTALQITPQENHVVRFSGRHSFTSSFSADAEINLSLFTRNLYQKPVSDLRLQDLSFFELRPSSRLSKAINAGLDYSPGRCGIYLKYKRIDPDYISLGSIFLTNDVEEISVGSTFSVADERLSGSVSTGLQRNNLDQAQVFTARRVIGSASLGWSPTGQVSFGANYSSFSSNSTARRDVFTDSIVFVQLTQTAGFTSSFAFGGKSRNVVMAGVSYQEAAGSQQSKTVFGNATISYNVAIGETGWRFTISGLANRLQSEPAGELLGYGPHSTIQKLLKKGMMRFSFSAGFQDNLHRALVIARNYTGSVNFSFAVSDRQNLKLDVSYLLKEGRTTGTTSFNESRAMVGYAYNFRNPEYDLKHLK